MSSLMREYQLWTVSCPGEWEPADRAALQIAIANQVRRELLFFPWLAFLRSGLVHFLAGIIKKRENAPRNSLENEPGAAHEFQVNRVGVLVNPEYSEQAFLPECRNPVTFYVDAFGFRHAPSCSNSWTGARASKSKLHYYLSQTPVSPEANGQDLGSIWVWRSPSSH